MDENKEEKKNGRKAEEVGQRIQDSGGQAVQRDRRREGSGRVGDPGGHPVWLAKSGAGGTAGGGSGDTHAPGVDDTGGRSDGPAQAGERAGEGDPAAEGGERVFGEGQRFFRRQPS